MGPRQFSSKIGVDKFLSQYCYIYIGLPAFVFLLFLHPSSVRAVTIPTSTGTNVLLNSGFFYMPQIPALGATAVQDVKGILDGGSLVVEGESPWVAGILDISLGEEVRKLVCGGAVLTSSHILTSGRCVTDWNAENKTHIVLPTHNFMVIAGDVSRMESEESEQVRHVKEIILHPGFAYDEAYKGQSREGLVMKAYEDKGFENDIAILVIEPPLNFSFHGVGFIPLGGSSLYSSLLNKVDPTGTEMAVVGWGITDKRQNTIPTGITLKKVILPFSPYPKKKQKGSYFGLVLDPAKRWMNFSAGIGVQNGLLGRCIGDRGGAVVTPSSSALGGGGWVQIGLVSFGIWCDRYIPSGHFLLLSPGQTRWIQGIIHPKTWAIASIFLLIVVLGTGSLLILRRNRNHHHHHHHENGRGFRDPYQYGGGGGAIIYRPYTNNRRLSS